MKSGLEASENPVGRRREVLAETVAVQVEAVAGIELLVRGARDQVGVAAAKAVEVDRVAEVERRIGGDVRFFCGFPPGGSADLLWSSSMDLQIKLVSDGFLKGLGDVPLVPEASIDAYAGDIPGWAVATRADAGLVRSGQETASVAAELDALESDGRL